MDCALFCWISSAKTRLKHLELQFRDTSLRNQKARITLFRLLAFVKVGSALLQFDNEVPPMKVAVYVEVSESTCLLSLTSSSGYGILH